MGLWDLAFPCGSTHGNVKKYMKRQCKMILPAKVIEQNSLEYILVVPVTALDPLLQELHYLLTIPFVLITFNSYSSQKP